jgi:hypothetical protein
MCDKPKGHDGPHWTYGGNELTWPAAVAPERPEPVNWRQEIANREPWNKAEYSCCFWCGVANYSGDPHKLGCVWARATYGASFTERQEPTP